jgi:hypothetical protein
MTNLGALEGLSDLEVGCVTSSNSYKLNSINEKKYDHSLNLVSTHTLNIKAPSQKIYVVDERSEHKTKPQLFQDYLYNLVNEKNSKKPIPNENFNIEEKKKDEELFDITEMGEYFTNTIYTERITTTNLLCKSQAVNDTYISCKQPALIVSSNTIVNFNTKDILLNGEHLEDLIKASLDETNMFKIKVIISTNKNPTKASFNLKFYMDMDGFQNIKYEDIFTYDIKFTIYCRKSSELGKMSDFDYVKVDNIEINMIGIKQNMHSDNKIYTFKNLDTRNEYELRASIKNTFTHTEVDYGVVHTGIVNPDHDGYPNQIITPAIYNKYYLNNSESIMSYEKIRSLMSEVL